MALVAAAIAVSAYIIWSTTGDAKREPVETAVGLGPESIYEADAREMAASEALGKATAFEDNNPNAKKEDVATRYKEVVSNFPGTAAARKAAKILKAPPRIVTNREFAETEYEETLKRATFMNPRIEAERMAEKPVVLVEEEKTEEKEVEKPVRSPQPAKQAVGLGAGGKYERDAREHAATAALADAIAFEYNNPNAKKEETAAKYKEVADNFPDTVAAREAAKILKEILKRDE
jgi:hypothetical protein